jgi:hypothetical protein
MWLHSSDVLPSSKAIVSLDISNGFSFGTENNLSKMKSTLSSSLPTNPSRKQKKTEGKTMRSSLSQRNTAKLMEKLEHMVIIINKDKLGHFSKC